MQIFKNLILSGLAMCNNNFPLALWRQLVRQCVVACNLLESLWAHPKVSAYYMLEGVHDFNKILWVPPATRATILDQIQDVWGPHAMDTWYVRTAWQHYWNWQFWILSTGG